MRVCLAQLEVRPGRPFANLERALALLNCAKDGGAALVLYPEMALPGYILGDLWERASFLRETLEAQDELVRAARGIAIAFGGLAVDAERKNEDGRVRKYNAFYLAQDGRLVPPLHGRRPFSTKTLMPNYREFDDSRHFFDTRKLALEEGLAPQDLISPHPLQVDGKTMLVGGILCEDGWDDDYTLKPQDVLVSKGAGLILNLSCSPYTLGKRSKRGRVFGGFAKRSGVPVLYCNCVGLQNNGKTAYTLDGDSTLYTRAGTRATRLPPFQEACPILELDPADQAGMPEHAEGTVELVDGLVYGTKKFLELTGIGRVVIGLSGGIDSALAACVYRQVLAAEDLLLVNMPSRHNSALTRGAAAELTRRLECPSAVVEIQTSVDATLRQLQDLEICQAGGGSRRLAVTPAMVENIQARDRSARVLAALAAAFGGGFTCNANKAELTVGYSTLYGDQAGFLANLGDLWKGQVYDCAREISRRGAAIPDAILNVKPSAELCEAQNPERGGGDPLVYPYHDALFRSWVEDWNRASPEEILQCYADGALPGRLGLPSGLLESSFPTAAAFVADLEHWWKCYNGLGLAKRIQAPPILAFSRRAFGFDQREAQLGSEPTRQYLRLREKILGNHS